MTTDVQELRALLAVATVRPWRADVWYGTDDGGWAAIGPHCVASEADGFDDAPETPSYDQARADAALIAAAVNALPELLDEVERLRVKADAADALQTEAARLRSDLDIERAQSAAFVKEIELLKAGIADAERWAAQSTASEVAALGVIKRAVSDMLRIPVSIEALAVSAIRQNLSDFRPSVAGSGMLDRMHAIETERDALLAEVEQLKSKVAAVSHECEVARDNSQAIYSAMVDLEHVRDRLDFQLYCADRDNDKAREENACLQAEIEQLKALRKGGE